MAATTITRTGVTLTNDTGSAASPAGDGTLLNNAWVQTFMDRIDSLISANITFGGLVTAEGFGTHTLSAAGTGAQLLTVRNTSAGTGNYSGLSLGTDAANAVVLRANSSTWTTTGIYTQNAGLLVSTVAGGLDIATTDAAGVIRFYSGNATAPVAKLVASGHLVLTELATNPGTSDLAADAAVAIYTKADKFVIAYNNGGTMTYITLDLDGSDITWLQSTSAP